MDGNGKDQEGGEDDEQEQLQSSRDQVPAVDRKILLHNRIMWSG